MAKSKVQTIDDKSIAVLPFINMSKDPDNEYFSDGITEEIINALTKVNGLKVIARTSSFAYKREHKDVRKIGKELNVSSILEGSVRRSKNRVRITAQLINSHDGSHYWSQNFDRELDDIFVLQDEISLHIANQIRENFGHLDIQDHLVKQSTINTKAYELFLKGRYYQLKWTSDSLKKATELYDEAIQNDPQFARAYYGNLQCYGLLGAWAFMNTKKAFEIAMGYFRKGQDLDTQLPEYTHSIMGHRFWGEWDFKQAYELINQTLETNPNYTDAIEALAELLIATGYFEEAEKHIIKALDIDPLSANHHYTLANINYLQKKFNDAHIHVEKSLSLNPDLLLAGELKIMCLIWLDQREEFHQFIADRKETELQKMLFEVMNGSLATIPNDLLKDWTKVACQQSKLVPYKLFIIANSSHKKEAMKMLESYVAQKRGQIINFRFEPFLEKLQVFEEFHHLHVSNFTLPKEKNPKSSYQPKTGQNNSELIKQFEELLQFIENDQPYLNPQLSLRSLAEQVNLHPNKLSSLINEQKGINFNELINHYRLDYFKRIAFDPDYKHMTLLGLAYESGFNSKTVFNAFFKKKEGITPSTWLKSAER